MLISPIDRFTPKYQVLEGSGCWIWTATRRDGYGLFKVDGRHQNAHRWSFEYHVGPIPEGLELDHLCRNRACVNPDHLEPVTKAENMARIPWTDEARRLQREGREKARVNRVNKTHCVHGHERNEVNTYVSKKGEKHCRVCHRERQARYRAERGERLVG